MDADRGGWWCWDHLDNFGHPSATRNHPQWQTIALGHHMAAGEPRGRLWWAAAPLEPARVLGLRESFDWRGRRERTRLIVSGWWALRPERLRAGIGVLMREPAHRIMQTRQFANLKRRSEQ